MPSLSKERLNALRNEIVMAEKLNAELLEPVVKEGLQRYLGNFTPTCGSDWDIALNEVYPIVQAGLPATFFRNPRAFLKPRNKTFIVKRTDPVTGKKVEEQRDSSKSAKTQEAILNYTVSEIKYKRETRKVGLDAHIFPHGVLWHGYKGEFGMTEEKSIYIKNDMVFVKRISPLRFLKDPSVSMSNIDEGKWVARILDVPLQDIYEDNKLVVDKQLVKGKWGYGNSFGTYNNKTSDTSKISQAGMGGGDMSTPSTLIDFSDDTFRRSELSRFVRVYECFLRPTKKEKRDGDKGWILLLTDEQTKPLRENKWSIKAEGFPAKILAFNQLNDNMFDMSDIDTYKTIADQKNAIINLQLRNAETNSKVWVGLSTESVGGEEDIRKIREGENTIVLFNSDVNPRDRMFVATPGGGASSELYSLDQRIQRNLEDKSGITDLKRGFLQSGEESAASVKIRAAGGSARPAYRQDLMADFLKESFEYLKQMLKQFVPIKEAVRIMGTLDIEWSENPDIHELQADTDVELDVISMLPENPETELRALNTTLALAIQALTTPTIAQKLAQEGKTINLSPIIEKILMRQRLHDPEIFRNIKPEESQGFVSIQQLREAEKNVDAALTGASIDKVPFPPNPNDDNMAKLSVYTSTQQLLKKMNQVSETLEQLIQIHTALLQQAQEKSATPGQKIQLSKPRLETV